MLAPLAVQAQTTATPALGGPTIDHLRATKTLRIAYRQNAAPFSSQEGTAAPSGYVLSLCQAIAQMLPQLAGVPSLTVTYVPVTAETRFDTISSGKADLLCDNTTMTISRRRIVDFSIPTFVDGAGLLVSGTPIADLKNLAGTKIGVVAGTTTQDALMNTLKALNIQATVVPVATYTDGLAKIDNGTITVLFGDRAVLAYLIPQSKAPSKLSLADNYLTIEPYALGLRHGDEDFRMVVDQALSRLYRSGQVMQIFTATFGQNAHPSPMILGIYTAASYPE
jgi:ABC-type amino acid transport substrate-binding protein